MATPYVTITTTDNGIRLTLTKEGRKHVSDAVKREENIASDSFLKDLLAHNFENGWRWVEPSEVGALTSAPMLSSQSDPKAVYWYEEYQLQSPVEEMLEEKHVDFDKAE